MVFMWMSDYKRTGAVESREQQTEKSTLQAMAVTVSCSTTHMLHNAPVRVTSRQSITSSNSSMLQMRREFGSIKLSHVSRASKNGDNVVRELASEKAVESGQQVADDSSKLANEQQSAVAWDARAEDASDAASYNSDVREKVVDVASDMAVDSAADVDDVARKDAEPLAQAFGRTVEDTAEALESKAAEVSDRESRKEA